MTQRIREALAIEGFDGYRGAYSDGRVIVAVVNPDAIRVVEPDQANMEIRGDGAVVGGRRGRWVWISGMYRHIPEGENFTEEVGPVTFISPADNGTESSADVMTRCGEWASTAAIRGSFVRAWP